jgi:hypothetical protein
MDENMLIHGMTQCGEKWYCPTELDHDDDDHSLAVPVDEHGQLFDSYEIELVPYRKKKLGEPIRVNVQKVKDFLQFDFYNFRVRLALTGIPMKYSGGLVHPDFVYQMSKVEMIPPGIDDLIFEETSFLILGCDSDEYELEN